MAMKLRLTDAESEALRAKAEQEGRSMQQVAKTAIAQYASDRPNDCSTRSTVCAVRMPSCSGA
jgi:hypothetical protein